MKIFKHTFSFPKLTIKDGELIEEGTREETYTFTLLHKGIGLYEELTNEPLLASLMNLKGEGDEISEDSVKSLFAKDFISNLACASYVKIDGDKFHNNRATAEEFKKTIAYTKCADDINFVNKLLQMATDCITEGAKADGKSKASSGKKR